MKYLLTISQSFKGKQFILHGNIFPNLGDALAKVSTFAKDHIDEHGKCNFIVEKIEITIKELKKGV